MAIMKQANAGAAIAPLLVPDVDDRHILAAAIVSQSNLIITFNLKDFPDVALRPYDIKAQHPDLFISNLLNYAPSQVCTAVKRHRASLKNPPKRVEEYLATLKQQHLPDTVTKLRSYVDIL